MGMPCIGGYCRADMPVERNHGFGIKKICWLSGWNMGHIFSDTARVAESSRKKKLENSIVRKCEGMGIWMFS